MEKRYLNSEEACKFLNVSIATLYRLKKEGLPYFKLGGSLRFDKSDLEKWIESLKIIDKK